MNGLIDYCFKVVFGFFKISLECLNFFLFF